MMNWLKNTISKLTSQDTHNYVVAEYHAKKKRVKRDHAVEYDVEADKNASGAYMNIDDLHQKN